MLKNTFDPQILCKNEIATDSKLSSSYYKFQHRGSFWRVIRTYYNYQELLNLLTYSGDNDFIVANAEENRVMVLSIATQPQLCSEW